MALEASDEPTNEDGDSYGGDGERWPERESERQRSLRFRVCLCNGHTLLLKIIYFIDLTEPLDG